MKKELKWTICIFSFLYFVDLVIMLKIKDVRYVGENHVKVGLATVNSWFRNLWRYDADTGFSMIGYNLSQAFGIISGLMCLFWIGLGIYQYSQNRDSSDIDKSLIATYGLYVLAVVFGVIYKGLAVNCGPVVLPGREVAGISFPSWHTMLYLVGMGSTTYLSGYFLEDKKVSKRRILMIRSLCVALMVLGVFVRMISGVEWLTDIVGAVCYTIPLLVVYSFFCEV